MRLPIRKILDYYFVNVLADNPVNPNIYCQCPFHEGTGKSPQNFSINRVTGLWICFSRKCGSGNIIKFIQKKEDCSQLKAKTLLSRRFFNGKGPSWSVLARSSVHDDRCKPQLPLPRLRWPQELDPIPFNHPFLAKRGISEAAAEHYRLAIQRSDFSRVWFPIFFNRKLRGFTARSIFKTALKKWKHGKGLPSSRLLYGFDDAKDKPWVIVTEGPLDVVRFWDLGFKNAVALFGTSFSVTQKVLIRQNWGRILVAMDGDEPGREAAAKIAEELRRKAKYLGVLTFPDDKDPGDLTSKDEFLEYCQSNVEVLVSKREGIAWTDAMKQWRS
jgi:DNA primase